MSAVDRGSPVGDRPASSQTTVLVHAMFALIAYLPILLTRPGQVSADTKTYLTVDPSRLLARAGSMWDSAVGAGTVTHQNIGLLFPLGPVYWIADRLAIPDWLIQRLLWGTIVFAALSGAYRLARWLGWQVTAAVVVALAYALSPYLLTYLARLSVIALPWAALPWLIVLAGRAVRERSWQAPARFALVIALVGSVNATSLVLVGLGPLIWTVVDLIGRRIEPRPFVAGFARLGVLCASVSLWWIAALRIQGLYGLPILRFTETYQAVASASTPAEIMRGMGYWFAYGGDRIGPWVEATADYTAPWLMGVGYLLVGGSLVGLTVPRRGRAPAIALLVAGLAIAVGAAPLGASTPYGRLFEWFATETTVGLALRSTPRAAPLVLLALALGLGAFTEAALERSRHTSTGLRFVPLAVIIAILVQFNPWFSANALTESILRAERLPEHRLELATWLTQDGDGRIWELPGIDFASYRWGGTVDPVLPGMIDRSVLARELVPQGAQATADLLIGFDRRLHEGTAEPEALVPIAELFAIESVVARNDIEYERYRTARPQAVTAIIERALGAAEYRGPLVDDEPLIPMIDEIALAADDMTTRYPVVAVWNLPVTRSILEVLEHRAVIVAGSGDGLVDMAAAGLIESGQPIIYHSTLTGLDPAQRAAIESDADRIVVTDTARRRAQRWSTLGSQYGALEAPGEEQLRFDPSDQRLDLGISDDRDRTTLFVDGAVRAIRATSFGNEIAFTPEDAARFAIDGDPATAWRTGVFGDIDDESLLIEFATPQPVERLRVLQPITLETGRYLTAVDLVVDDELVIPLELDATSRSLPGQEIVLGEPVTANRLRIDLVADNLGPLSSYSGQPGVGIAEIALGDLTVDFAANLPTDWLADIPGLDAKTLEVVMTRERIDPATPNRSDPEPTLVREFTLPEGRAFTIEGTARVDTSASDTAIAGLMGLAADISTSDRLPGSALAWGYSAFDGDPVTAWTTAFETAPGATMSVRFDEPTEIARFAMQWSTSSAFTIPTALRLSTPAGEVRDIDLTAGEAGRVAIDIPAMATDELTIEIAAVEQRRTPEYFSGVQRLLPVAISEIDLFDASGQAVGPDTSERVLDARCRSDLIEIDGSSVAIRLDADPAAALARGAISFTGCEEPIVLSAGAHRLRTNGDQPVTIDRIVLVSPGSAPRTAVTISSPEFERPGPTRLTASVDPRPSPSWLVLRESWNPGWTATLDGIALGEPILIDGYANGWLLPASAISQQLVIDWAPQRTVEIAGLVSVLGLIVTLVLARPRRRRAAGAPVPVIDGFAAGTEPPALSAAFTLGTLVVLVVVGGPAAALTAGVVVLLAPYAPRWFGAASAFVLWGVGALAITALQFGYDYPSDPDWPSRFAAVAPLSWAAIGAIVGAYLGDRRRAMTSQVA